MDIKIRKATPDDFPAVLLLINEFSIFQKTPEKVHITLEQMNEDKELFQCIVAEKDGQEIIGFASFFFAYYSWSGKSLYLDDLYVQSPYRKLRIGSQLLQNVIDFAKQEKCKKVRWLVSKWNTNAINFYKSIGAVLEETEIICDLEL